jgi:hypothetical protein
MSTTHVLPARHLDENECREFQEPYERWHVQIYKPRSRKDKWRTVAAGPAFWARRFYDDYSRTLPDRLRLVRQDGSLAAESAGGAE